MRAGYSYAPPPRHLAEIIVGKEYGFLVYSRGSTRPPRRPQALASQGRRLDIVSRVMLAALYARGPVEDKAFMLVALEPPGEEHAVLLLSSECLPEAMEVEYEASDFLVKTLYGETACIRVPGVGYGYALAVCRKAGFELIMMSEHGVEPRPEHFKGRKVYIIGTNVDPPATPGVRRVRVDTESLLASTVAVLINVYRWLVEWTSRGCDEG